MKRKKILSPEEVLNAKVVVNTAVRTEEKGKELIIVVSRKKSFFVNLLSFVLVVPREKKVVLDELGAEVYRDCRQNLPVSEIVANFKKRHNVSEDYSRQSVMIYLKTLAQRSIVGFLITEESKNG
ncbi:MAG: PqqD family protein [Candidatus Omnitrophota bacterium]|nr:PqqD family protein [Candidatus Omnitrophota bacterium]